MFNWAAARAGCICSAVAIMLHASSRLPFFLQAAAQPCCAVGPFRTESQLRISSKEWPLQTLPAPCTARRGIPGTRHYPAPCRPPVSARSGRRRVALPAATPGLAGRAIEPSSGPAESLPDKRIWPRGIGLARKSALPRLWCTAARSGCKRTASGSAAELPPRCRYRAASAQGCCEPRPGRGPVQQRDGSASAASPDGQARAD